MRRSIPDNAQLNQSLDKVARNSSANGAAVQSGSDAFQRMVFLDVGSWTDGIHKFTVEDSPDGSTWTALTASQLDDPAGKLDSTETNTVIIDSAADDDSFIELGLLSIEDYVRVVQTVSGATTGLIAGANVLTEEFRAAGGVGQPMSATGYQRTDPSI